MGHTNSRNCGCWRNREHNPVARHQVCRGRLTPRTHMENNVRCRRRRRSMSSRPKPVRVRPAGVMQRADLAVLVMQGLGDSASQVERKVHCRERRGNSLRQRGLRETIYTADGLTFFTFVSFVLFTLRGPVFGLTIQVTGLENLSSPVYRVGVYWGCTTISRREWALGRNTCITACMQ